MELTSVFLVFSLFVCIDRSDANPVYSIVASTPQGLISTGTLGSGISGSQILTNTTPSLQSPIIQLVRQPSNVNGGLTQFVVPGQQSVLNGVGAVPLVSSSLSGLFDTTGLTSSLNGFGVSYRTPNNAGFSVVNVNGVPMLVSSAGLGLNNGFQASGVTSGLPQQVGGSSVVNPIYLQQPVVREVTEVQEVETPSSLVQLDPMDAALLDMENKGQMHMEKYAWGRSSPLNNNPKSSQRSNDNNAAVAGDLRSDLPRFYSPLPTGSLVSSQPVDIANRDTTSQLRNPFVDANGKRKKHFEFYQYFRNLNMNQPQVAIPVAVTPAENIFSE